MIELISLWPRAAASLIEGTDGTGTKMSKSKGDYVSLTAPPGEIFGKIMSVPDRLVEQYFRALSEWRTPNSPSRPSE
ncbi:MAG TPA: hypothetical protein VFO16_17055 [Pseudonocardiaceae bacterium]|nr:hypothetical protein [Pseudonocardiaceae bacterium]